MNLSKQPKAPLVGEQVIDGGVAIATILGVVGYNPAYQAYVVKTSLGQMPVVPDGFGAWMDRGAAKSDALNAIGKR